MYLHKTKNEHYTPPCCYFSGELEVVEGIRNNGCGWHDVLRAYAKQFGISKLENIVSGGKNGQDSIRNGLYDIVERYKNDDDVVLIHDAIRPMVTII